MGAYTDGTHGAAATDHGNGLIPDFSLYWGTSDIFHNKELNRKKCQVLLRAVQYRGLSVEAKQGTPSFLGQRGAPSGEGWPL